MAVLVAACCGMLAVGQAPLSGDAANSLMAAAPTEAVSRPHTVTNSLVQTVAISEAISRPHTVANSLVQTVAIGEAISRPNTVENRTVRQVDIREAVSRSQTVANAIGDTDFAFREAISRPHTVQNRTIREAVFQEAISRSSTVQNNAPPPRSYTEAISRSHTVYNTIVPKVAFAESISRASTVLNHPELLLRLESEAGNTTVNARCGESIRYQVTGTMSDENNQGLALVGFDVRFDGGDLPLMDTPTGEPSCENPMVSFVAPAGLTEPAGFGGILIPAQGALCGHPNGIPGGLAYVGGCQNTFGDSAGKPDFARFVDCFAGPNEIPTPTLPLRAREKISDAT